MTKSLYHIIGVMSGTSLDGIDVVYASIQSEDWNFEIFNAETIPYSIEWQTKLKEAVNYSEVELQNLDEAYTIYLSNVILKFVRHNAIQNLDAVCSHGHTVLHQPGNKITFQIGNLPIIAKKLNNTVICDFRVQDVEFGGQGAPLVPIGDRLLFSSYDYCLNLGGFANISFEMSNKRIAFDICPINIVMNHYCQSIGINYDDKGEIASNGKIDKILLEALNELEFYKQIPPKSLGLEWVKTNIFPLIDDSDNSVENILRTFVEHAAIQISQSMSDKKGKVLVTGGGAYNDFLISRLKEISVNEIIIPSREIIEYKEALIFGLLGVLKLKGEINCLSSVTGAFKDHSSGKIFVP